MNSASDKRIPKITVIIPCYNSGTTISRAVDSCLNQSWKNIEIIVVDDGSDDQNTIKQLEKLNSIRLIRQHNLGLPSARNFGAKHAKGDWIIFLDADDWLEKDAVEELKKAINGTSNNFSFPYLNLQGEAKGVLKNQYNFFEQLFLNQLPYCLLISKEDFWKFGGYDEKMQSGYEDWEFNIRLGSGGLNGKAVAKPLMNYQVSSGGMLLSRSLHQHSELWGYIQQKHHSVYKAHSLFALWRFWKEQKSSYPLLIYPLLLFLHKSLPPHLFNRVFLIMRKFSKSNRLQSSNICAE